MKNLIARTTLLVLLTGFTTAKPINDKDCERKSKYYQVNCAEQLQFFNPKATCFINDNGDFMIMTMDKSRGISAPIPIHDILTENPLENNVEAKTPIDTRISRDDEKNDPLDSDSVTTVSADDVLKPISNLDEKKEEPAKQDNSGALLLAILGIAILAG